MYHPGRAGHSHKIERRVHGCGAADHEGPALLIDPLVLKCLRGDFCSDSGGVAHCDGDKRSLAHESGAPWLVSDWLRSTRTRPSATIITVSTFKNDSPTPCRLFALAVTAVQAVQTPLLRNQIARALWAPGGRWRPGVAVSHRAVGVPVRATFGREQARLHDS